MKLDITVVIPTKNRSALLKSCLESVLSQTREPREIIVVDDSSTDDTHEVLMSYASRGVRYIRNEISGGAQVARNIGIRNARFDWIAFQDSDDIWLPDKLASQAASLAGREMIENFVVHCNGSKEEINSGVTEKIPMLNFSGTCYPKILLNAGPMFQGLLVHKSKLFEIGLLDEQCPSYQEWDTTIRLARIAEFIHIETPLFHWRWHEEDTISKNLCRDFLGFQYVIEKHQDEIIRIHGRRTWNKILSRNLNRGLQFRCFTDVLNCIEQQPPSLPKFFAGALAKLGICPAGTAQLMKIAGLASI